MAGDYNLGTAEGIIRIKYDGTGTKKAQQDMDVVAAKGDKTKESLNKLGNTSLVAGLALAGGLAYATNKAVDFEHQISAVAAVSGASQTQLDQLRKKALQLGADTSFSATQSAQAMEELAKAGISTTDILNGAADATVALAAAGGVTLPESATIAANAMNQFGLTAKQLPKIVDQIAGAANTSAIGVGDLGRSMQQVGAVAHLAGLSFNDTAVAIAEMGNAGIKGSDAGTSLKTFLQNLIPQTKIQRDLMLQLGITTADGGNRFFDAAGKAKSLADISQVLQNALKGQTKEQQLLTLQTLFGTDAIRAAAVLSDQGAAGFNNMAAAINKTSAADVASARLNNTAGKIEQLKGSMETLSIQVGEALLPSLTKLVTNLTQMVNWFTRLSPATQATIVTIAKVAATILILVAVTIKIYNAVKAFMVIWEALNLEFLFSPIGLIIIAIVALVAAFVILWNKSAAFRNFWKSLWNDIWGFLKTIGAWFAGPFANFFTSRFATVWNFFKAVGAWFAGPFAGFFVSLWGTIKTVFTAIATFVMESWNGIKQGALDVWNFISPIINFFAPLFQAAFGLMVSVTKLAWSIITAVFQVAVAIIKPIVELWLTGMRILWTAVWDAMKAVALGFWRGLMFVVQPVISLLKPLIELWLTGMRILWTAIWDAMSAVAMGFWRGLLFVVQPVINILGSLISVWLHIVEAIWTAAWGGLKAFFSNVWQGIVTVITGARNTIINVIDGIKVIVDRIRSFFNQLRDAASGGVGSLIAFVAGIPGKVLSAIGNLGSLLYNAGKSIIQGLINGISDMVGRVKDAVSNVLSAARNLLPFSPAKEGPFSGKGWTLYSGQSISDALAEGIMGHADRAVNATYQLVSKVNTAAGAQVSPLAQQFTYSPPQGGQSTSSQVNNLVINAPAPIVDPKQLADYMLRRLNSAITTRAIPTK